MAVTTTKLKIIDQKVDHWQARLFDLSGRNRHLLF